MSVIFKSTRPVPDEKAAPRLGSDARLSGADSLLARDRETVTWLSKCYADMVTDRKRWPIFEERKLGAFLGAIGVDLEAAAKAATDEPSEIPAYCDSMEQSVKRFDGASFLSRDVHTVCAHLRSRRALARI